MCLFVFSLVENGITGFDLYGYGGGSPRPFSNNLEVKSCVQPSHEFDSHHQQRQNQVKSTGQFLSTRHLDVSHWVSQSNVIYLYISKMAFDLFS